MVRSLVHYQLIGDTMGQGEILERLYYVPELTAVELSIVLNLNNQSVVNCLRRLRKFKYVEMIKNYRYRLTDKGRDFAKRYYI